MRSQHSLCLAPKSDANPISRLAHILKYTCCPVWRTAQGYAILGRISSDNHFGFAAVHWLIAQFDSRLHLILEMRAYSASLD